MSGIISLLCPGSIPERDGDKLYNTCTVFSPTARSYALLFLVIQTLLHTEYSFYEPPIFALVQIHLADTNIPGKDRLQESEALTPGNDLMTFDTGVWLSSESFVLPETHILFMGDCITCI